MRDKSVLNKITKKICVSAKETPGGVPEKVVLFGFYAGGDKEYIGIKCV